MLPTPRLQWGPGHRASDKRRVLLSQIYTPARGKGPCTHSAAHPHRVLWFTAVSPPEAPRGVQRSAGAPDSCG